MVFCFCWDIKIWTAFVCTHIENKEKLWPRLKLLTRICGSDTPVENRPERPTGVEFGRSDTNFSISGKKKVSFHSPERSCLDIFINTLKVINYLEICLRMHFIKILDNREISTVILGWATTFIQGTIPKCVCRMVYLQFLFVTTAFNSCPENSVSPCLSRWNSDSEKRKVLDSGKVYTPIDDHKYGEEQHMPICKCTCAQIPELHHCSDLFPL